MAKLTKAEVLIAYDEKSEQVAFSQDTIRSINDALNSREQFTTVFNGVPYSENYEYNIKKGINYFPPKGKEDRQASYGIPHEKILAFCSIFLKYVFAPRVRCYGKDMQPVVGLGEIYRLAIEFSRQVEKFNRVLALVYNELFTQGNAFVLEDWEVRTFKTKEAYQKGKKLTADDMDFTYEFIDNSTFKDGEKIQKRKARSIVLDGRRVIFGNPEIEDVQDQPFIVIEEELDETEAEEVYGSLKRWKSVPRTAQNILVLSGLDNKQTLFNSSRWQDKNKKFIVHRYFNKKKNLFNIFINGVMMFDMGTPMTFFYPEGNYPLTNVASERLKGSIYARSVPAKTKFNDDYINFILNKLAIKLEQGIEPPIITRGKYLLTRDMFKPGAVTHGVRKDQYDYALSANQGITNSEFSMLNLFKEIIETQTLNPTATGEVSDATATSISLADAGQKDKLAYIMDGIILGFVDMAERRLETIKWKYTMKRNETLVDSKKVNVYTDFTVNLNGVDHSVSFNDSLPTDPTEIQAMKDTMFEKSFQTKKEGNPTEYYQANPFFMVQEGVIHIVETKPERIKDSNLQMISMFDEFAKLLGTFGPSVNTQELQKIYTDSTGRSSSIFLPKELVDQKMAQAETQSTNTGSMGKPRIKQALQREALTMK